MDVALLALAGVATALATGLGAVPVVATGAMPSLVAVELLPQTLARGGRAAALAGALAGGR